MFPREYKNTLIHTELMSTKILRYLKGIVLLKMTMIMNMKICYGNSIKNITRSLNQN